MRYYGIFLAIFPSLFLAENVPNDALLTALKAQHSRPVDRQSSRNQRRSYRGTQLSEMPPGVPIIVRERRDGCYYYTLRYRR